MALRDSDATRETSTIVADVFRELGHAVAVARADGLALVLANCSFTEIFPPLGDGEDTLATRLPELDPERLASRLARNRPYSLDLERKRASRSRSFAVEIRGRRIDGTDYAIAECRDVSKQREAEYMLDSYSKLSERRTREVEREKDRVEKLLLNLMPRTVYKELRDFGAATPKGFDSASVLMLDFVGFTEMSAGCEPSTIVAELNDIFSAFDRIVELFGCERIKTIGDAYLAVSGVPDPNVDHTANVARTALRFRRYLEKRNLARQMEWSCRIGIHTGPLIGSLIGIQKYVYDVFGPAVNMASRLEHAAQPMQICLSADTLALLGSEFRTEPIGEVNLQGIGPTALHALTGERAL